MSNSDNAQRRMGERARRAWDGRESVARLDGRDRDLLNARVDHFKRARDAWRVDGATDRRGDHDAAQQAWYRHYLDTDDRTQDRNDGLDKEESAERSELFPKAPTDTDAEGAMTKRARTAWNSDNGPMNRMQAARGKDPEPHNLMQRARGMK